MDQNNNIPLLNFDDQNGPKTLFLSGSFHYERSKNLSTGSPSSNDKKCSFCPQETQFPNLTPSGPQMRAQHDSMHPCESSFGVQNPCRSCGMLSKGSHPCCMHCLVGKYHCGMSPCIVMSAPCIQYFGIHSPNSIHCHCRTQNPWDSRFHPWMQSSSSIQSGEPQCINVPQPTGQPMLQKNQEETKSSSRSDSIVSNSSDFLQNSANFEPTENETTMTSKKPTSEEMGKLFENDSVQSTLLFDKPQTPKSLDDLREKLQSVFRCVSPKKVEFEVDRNAESSKDLSKIDGNHLSPPVETQQTTHLEEHQVSQKPAVRKSSFRILKVVEYVDPEQEEKMSQKLSKTSNKAVLKDTNMNCVKPQAVREVPQRVNGSRFTVIKVEENVNKPIDKEVPMLNGGRIHKSKTVDKNLNEIPLKEMQPVNVNRFQDTKVEENVNKLHLRQMTINDNRFYMCKIVDTNGNQPVRVQSPVKVSRFRVIKVDEDAARKPIAKAEGASTSSNGGTPPTCLEEAFYLKMDERELSEELSLIMNEAHKFNNKLCEIESNDKLERGAIKHRAVEIKKNRNVWLNFMNLRQTLDPSYREPTPKDYDCDIRIRLYKFLRRVYTEVHFNSFYMIAQIKENEHLDPNSPSGISLRFTCIQKLVEMRKKLVAMEESLNF